LLYLNYCCGHTQVILFSALPCVKVIPMPFLALGSSGLPMVRPTPDPELKDKLAALMVDEPLPSEYGRDRIRLLAQSPRRLYAYWDFARDPFIGLSRTLGARSADYALAVRLVDTDNGSATVNYVTPARNYWFEATPDRPYRAEIGFLGPDHIFIRLLASGVVRSPRASVSSRTDSTPEFRVRPYEFAQVLERAGYVADAIEVSLEAADEETESSISKEMAFRLTGADLPELNERELTELRGMLAALALGASIEDIIRLMSQSLADWLRAIEREGRADLSMKHILELLRSMLGLESEPIVSGMDPHRAARVVLGASEVNLPTPPVHLWMPSMTRSSLSRSEKSR
jgi:hypothetical protein